MTNNRVRIILLWAWLIFFLIDLLIFLILFFQGYIEWIDLKPSLKSLNTIFAPYLGVIIIYFFNSNKEQKINERASVSGILAITGSCIWNILIFIFLIPLLWHQGTVEDSLEIIDNISTLFVWLIAAAFGYYFAKDK